MLRGAETARRQRGEVLLLDLLELFRDALLQEVVLDVVVRLTVRSLGISAKESLGLRICARGVSLIF